MRTFYPIDQRRSVRDLFLDPLLDPLLARHAGRGSGDGVEALLGDLLAALDAGAVLPLGHPLDGRLHPFEDVPLRVAKRVEELLSVGAGGLVGEILRAPLVRLAAVVTVLG